MSRTARQVVEAIFGGIPPENEGPGPEPLNKRFNWKPPQETPDEIGDQGPPSLSPEEVQKALRDTPNIAKSPIKGRPGTGGDRMYTLKELIPDEELMTPDNVIDVGLRAKQARSRAAKASLQAQAKSMSAQLDSQEAIHQKALDIVNELLETHPDDLGKDDEKDDDDGGEKRKAKFPFFRKKS